jgi:hypothetical protein
MQQALALEKPQAASHRTAAVSLALFIILLSALSIYCQEPSAEGAQTALADFSARRAMEHVRQVAQRPHPLGTVAHDEAHAYIVEQMRALGVNAESHESIAINERTGYPFHAGTVRNIVGRLKGADNTKAVMIVGHYDSTPNGPGAADDASAVGIVLETLNALKAGPQLRNDVIFLLTDGEETGLLGAKAFADEADLSKQVGLVMNFEARGVSGPSVMFETGAGNRWVIGEFSKAAPQPVANSLMSDIYKLLPNDTDFSVFKQAGLPGLNFAFIRGAVYYHSMRDNVAALDERSLQHQGAYALALARHFGNLGFETDQTDRQAEAIYFDAGPFFINYPKSWAIPLSLLIVLVFTALTVIGLKKKRLTLSGVVRGFLAFLLTTVVIPLAITGLWFVIAAIHSQYKALLSGDTYNSGIYMLGFTALGAAAFLALYNWFGKRIGVQDLAVGAMLLWVVLCVASSLILPGASYLFFWPLLSSLVGLGLTLFLKPQPAHSIRNLSSLLIFSIPAILLFAPVVYLLFIALTVSLPGPGVTFLVLVLGLLIPHLALLGSGRKWLAPGLLTVAALALIAAGSLTSGFSEERPKPSTLFYCLDRDAGKAVWATVDRAPDEWTGQFFSAERKNAPLTEYLYKSSRPFLQSDAPVQALPPPEVSLLGDTTEGGIRTVSLRITSHRQAPLVAVYLNPEAKVRSTTVNGKQVDSALLAAHTTPESAWGMRYFAPSKGGINLVLQLESPGPLKMRVVDQSYELPSIPGLVVKDRPGDLIVSMYPVSDSTLVYKSFSF